VERHWTGPPHAVTSPHRNPPPLQGIRVVECSDHEGVSYCGRTLAALGADVVKLEPIAGDPLRQRPPLVAAGSGRVSVAFEYLNAGKRSIAVDPSEPEGLAAASRVVAAADVVLTSPEQLALFGIDAVARPPRQIRALAGAFGGRTAEGGPTSAFTRFHASSSGYLTPADKDRSARPGWAGPYAAEAMFGTCLAVAVVAELGRGTGGEIDFSYQGYGVWMDKMFFPRVALSDSLDLHRYTTAYPFGGNMACKDGFACIFVIEEHQWRNLVRTLEKTEWLADPRFATGVLRLDVQEEIDEVLAAWCAARTVDEVVTAGRTADFPVGRVRPPTSVLAQSESWSRGFLTEMDTGFGRLPVAGLPFGPGLPSVVLPRAPRCGEHGGTVPADWGMVVAARAAAPLAGLKVLDLTWAAAGPVITSIMAFLGADIVKVEHRSRPDLMRVAQKQYGYSSDDDLDSSPIFQELAAGKRSIELDLRDPHDRQVALRLAAVADVLVENMRPGKVEQLGLSYDAVRAVNPGIVMCSQSATGRVDGPAIPGYAPIFWAEGGGAWLTGWPDRRPGVVRGPVDFHAAAFACLGTLALLLARANTGVGGYIDCAAIETVSGAFGPEILYAAVTGQDPSRCGNAFPGMLLNDVFPSHGDDQWIAVTVGDEVEWEAFCRALGRPDLAPGGYRDDRYGAIAEVTSKCDASRLEGRLLALGVPAAQCLSLRSSMSDARLAGRGIWQRIHHPVIGEQTIVGLPWTFDGQPYEIGFPGPALGEHGDRVRKEWLGE
jgi:crotonobetainyl-CoA:carnitine CoA-transferase CaiB-like acyl-CoA transferase